MEGTTRAATADRNTGAAGRGPGCNMESPIRGDKEEGVHTAGAGLPAAEALPAGREVVPRGKGALAGGGAEESYLANTALGGTAEEAKGRLSPAAPLRPAAAVRQGAREKDLSGDGVLSGGQSYGGCSRSD